MKTKVYCTEMKKEELWDVRSTAECSMGHGCTVLKLELEKMVTISAFNVDLCDLHSVM
jgi:hypothetical protein